MVEKVPGETEILLIGVSCEVCEHCGALAFKVEKGQVFIIAVYFPNFFAPKSLK
jgi:hypothetical protein